MSSAKCSMKSTRCLLMCMFLVPASFKGSNARHCQAHEALMYADRWRQDHVSVITTQTRGQIRFRSDRQIR
jgi:hypothetical protein